MPLRSLRDDFYEAATRADGTFMLTFGAVPGKKEYSICLGNDSDSKTTYRIPKKAIESIRAMWPRIPISYTQEST